MEAMERENGYTLEGYEMRKKRSLTKKQIEAVFCEYVDKFLKDPRVSDTRADRILFFLRDRNITVTLEKIDKRR